MVDFSLQVLYSRTNQFFGRAPKTRHFFLANSYQPKRSVDSHVVQPHSFNGVKEVSAPATCIQKAFPRPGKIRKQRSSLLGSVHFRLFKPATPAIQLPYRGAVLPNIKASVAVYGNQSAIPFKIKAEAMKWPRQSLGFSI